MGRLKNLLNEYSDCLVSDGHDYCLSPKLRIAGSDTVAQSSLQQSEAPEGVLARSTPRPAGRTSLLEKLSRRQQKALELVERLGELSAPELAKSCRTTRMTAYRDLQGLCDLGVLYATGKARQTRYRLSP